MSKVDQQFSIGRLQRSELEIASHMLAEAFQEDPIFNWLIPGADKRIELASTILMVELKHGYFKGEVYKAGSVEGIVVWMPPDSKDEMDFWSLCRTGALTLIMRVGRSIFSRIQAYEKYVHQKRKKLIDFPHWYLSLLGVSPSRQGEGLAGRLLEYKFKEIEKDSYPVFLETHNEEVIDFYKKFGFEIIEEDLIENQVPYWALLKRG